MLRLISFAVAAIPVTLLATQSPADFSGRWIAVEPQRIAGHELVITQDAGTLRLEQMRLSSGETYDESGRARGPLKGERESTIYRLDGEVLATKRGEQSVRSSLRRDNERILLRDQYHPPGVTFERSLSFDKGGRLVLEHRRPALAYDPSQASDGILDIRRMVFERR